MIFAYIDPGSGFTFLNLGAWLIALAAGSFSLLLLFLKRFFRYAGKKPQMILIFALLAAAATGLTMVSRSPRAQKKIVILGLDGMSPDIVERLLSEQRLPNLAALQKSGGYARLATTNPAQSPVAWAGCITGKNPGRHGIFDFIVRDADTGKIRLSLSRMHRGKPQPVIAEPAFWTYLRRKHVPSVILHCPLSFPPEKINGKLLSGMGVPDILGTEGTFSFYTSEPGQADKPDTGGWVVPVSKTSPLRIELRGPRVQGLRGTARHALIPVDIVLDDTSGAATLRIGKRRIILQPGQWSAWQEIEFPLGWGKTLHGIVKFYLISTSPHFKLFAGPVNFHPEQPVYPLSFPAGYSKELARALGFFHTQGMPLNTWGVNEHRIDETALLQQAETRFTEQRAILDYELQRFRGGVLFFYTELTDVLQHMFWRNHETAHDPWQPTITHWYERMDALVGHLRKNLSPEDTLIILSDHGFGPFRRACHVNSWLRDHGYLIQTAPAPANSELLNGVDWQRTTAYALGFSGIYLTHASRALREKLREELLAWRDEVTDEPVLADVYRREDIYHGKHTAAAPDLILGFARGFRASWQTALGAVPAVRIEDNQKKWSGDHLIDPALVPGILFTNKPLTKTAPSIYDLTPTILSEAGFTTEEIAALGMDGETLFRP
ncbi:MAG: alkaline phosphatase family protein [Candidatus Omnitrophica bacterium]|nr:alkaline phosphatase family protein [Candidatus Omnitrophota bacterium]